MYVCAFTTARAFARADLHHYYHITLGLKFYKDPIVHYRDICKIILMFD